MSISAAQCRAARALLDWSQDQLAANAQVARATIADFERNVRTPMRNNLVSIVSSLEAAGVGFVPESDEGCGVRFQKIEHEYSTNLKVWNRGLSLHVKYKGKPHVILIPEVVIDDIDGTNYHSADAQRKAVQNHLPIFLRAAEEAIIYGPLSDDGSIVLAHRYFPDGTF